jgi:hypothetical protein
MLAEFGARRAGIESLSQGDENCFLETSQNSP